MYERIFKAYDVRGLYPDELDETVSRCIGSAFAKSDLVGMDKKSVVVGRDMRESSDVLFEALVEGLNAGGMPVIDIGLSTTPMLYFAVNVLDAAGGIMITASHNPQGYNGFKFVREEAIPISAETGLERIQKIASETSLPRAGDRQVVVEDVGQRYRDFFAQRFCIELDHRVVIDTGNGMAGAILPAILETQRIPYRSLYFEPDGRFPHHEANPLKEENLQDLRDVMSQEPDSIGVAFDGDGDRVAFLDEDGSAVRGDLLTALIAKKLLEKKGPGTILYDLRSSKIVPEVIRANGGRPVMSRVGHSFIKALMRKEKALFAGELSFHFYFSDFFYCESGILAMLTVLQILANSGERLASMVAPLTKYAHSGEINFAVKDKKQAMEKVKQQYTDGRVLHLDGLSVEYDNWWFNLRPSNTEPLLRLNLEADTEVLMHEKAAELEELITKVG